MTKAIILCAGEGTRLLPLTKDIPKPMITVGELPLLEYNILFCKKNGIDEIFINTSYLPDKIREYFGDGSSWGVKIRYSYEKELLGTAGALKNFKEDLCNGDFVVIYGDNLTDINLAKMIEEHKTKKSFATLFLHQQNISDKSTTIGAVTLDGQKRILNFFENPTPSESEKIKKFPIQKRFINAGLYILSPKVFEHIINFPCDFAKDIFPKAITQGKELYGITSDGFYRELGSKERYFQTDKEIKEGKIKLSYLK